MHARQLDVDLVVEQLAANRIREADDRVLRAAVRRLQRNRPVREGRADLDDRAAVARNHPIECGACAPHVAEVRHLRHAFELLRRHRLESTEHGRHRVVDPDVDWTEVSLDLNRACEDLLGIGDIAGQSEVDLRLAQAILTAREHRDFVACRRKTLGGGASHAGGASGNDRDFHAHPQNANGMHDAAPD